MSLKTCSLLGLLVLSVACGSVEPLNPDGGGSGSGGSSGTGGSSGSGGTAGSGGASDARPDSDGNPMCGTTCDIACPYGYMTGVNGCPICGCKPPAPCTATECPVPPPYAYPTCPGGGVIPAACTRGLDNQCAWHPPTCGKTCSAVACDIACPDGFQTDANGCETCMCKSTGCPAGTQPVACPAIGCDLFCADGYVRGIDGCETCACRPPATCNVGGACVACPFGYRKGPNGCASCACDDAPSGCVTVINAGTGV